VERDHPTLDQQYWPVGVSLVALTAFLIGLASVHFDFNDPRWRSNAYVVNGAILAAAVTLAYALRRLGQQYGKHLMQAAVVLSILVHLILGVAIVQLILSSRVIADNANGTAQRRAQLEEEEDVPIPLELQSPEKERPEDEPIEVADASAAATTVARTDASQSSSLQVQVKQLTEVVDTVRPSILDRQESPSATPKMADAESQMSRHVAENPLVDSQITPVDQESQPDLAIAEVNPSNVDVRPTESQGVAERQEQTPTETLDPSQLKRAELAASDSEPTQAVPVPRRSAATIARNTTVEPIASAEESPRDVPDAQQLAVDRTRPEPSITGRVESPRLDAAPEQVTLRTQPREHQSDPDLTVAATPLPRSNNLRKLTSETDAEMVAEVTPSDNAPSSQPSETAVARTESSNSSVERETVQPADTAQVESQRPLRMVRSEQDREAPSAGAIERQLSATPSVSSVADALSEQSVATAEVQSREGLRPTDSAVQKQAVASADTTERQQPSETAQLDDIASLARAISRRQISSDVPTLMPQQVPDRTPRRSVRVAELQSPEAVDSPAFVEAPSADTPTAQPKVVALDRGRFGEAGTGVSRNMRNELPGPERPSPVASGSARRPEDTANPSDLPTLQSGQNATIARSQSDQRQPSVANQAIPVEGPTTSQEQSESQLAAAGTAVEQTRSNSNRGEFSADKGDLAVDVGPTRIMSEFQSGRLASGGGQPDLSSQLNRQQPRDRTSGGTPRILLATDVPSDQVASAAGQGGGRPQAMDASPLAVGPRRADPGITPSTNGDIARANRPGPSAEMSAADLFGPLALPRATGIRTDDSSSIVGNASPQRGLTRRAPGLSSDEAGDVTNQDSEDGGPPALQPGELADAAIGPPVPGGGSLSRNMRSVRGPQPMDTSVATVDDLGAGDTGSGAPDTQADRLAGLDNVTIGRNTDRTMAGGGTNSNDRGKDVPAESSGGRTGAGSDNRATSNVTGREEYVALQPGDQRPNDVDVVAPDGVGGIGRKLAKSVGSTQRDSRLESSLLSVKGPRFVRRTPGGRPQMSATAAMATEAFKERMQVRTQEKAGREGGPRTDQTIELGLTFLARNQGVNGGWSLAGYGDEEPAMVSDTAATGLALLAFQGAGYHHLEYKYAEKMQDALRYLVSNQREDGGLFIPGNPDANAFAEFYSHGIAAIAVCEAYGMTQDPWLKEPAQKSLDFIVKTQTVIRPTDGSEPYGGWRYTVGMGPDTSVSGWMLMALKSGELAGLNVPKEPYKYMEGWLNRAQASKEAPHRYRYNPFADEDARRSHGRRPSKTMTAVGLLMRLYLDWDRKSTSMKRGGNYLAESLPAMGDISEPPTERSRDTYYWYYATQVMFHLGGEHWEAWNGSLQPLLVDSQIKSGPDVGSWDPLNPVPDRWAGHGGRLYVTTMNLLSLEVPYRHLPLYEDTAK
jgi:hypothetical protein